MNALQEKEVLKEISLDDNPSDAKEIRTMWDQCLKTDQYGYVTRFKAQLVALGKWQRPGIDFMKTFAPVARMSSFRLVLALSAKLGLKIFGVDDDTAY